MRASNGRGTSVSGLVQTVTKTVESTLFAFVIHELGVPIYGTLRTEKVKGTKRRREETKYTVS